MKKLLMLFVLSAVVSAYGQKTKNNDTSIVFIGKGMDGILFGVSTEEEVAARFGSEYWPEEVLIRQYFDDKKQKSVTIYNYKMKYLKKGLIFNFTKEEGVREILTSIEIFPPYIVKTKEGVILGKSTLQEVVDAYGYGKWGYSNKNNQVAKVYDGIVFYTTNKKYIREYDKDYFNNTFLKAVVDKIVVTSDPKAVYYLDKVE